MHYFINYYWALIVKLIALEFTKDSVQLDRGLTTVNNLNISISGYDIVEVSLFWILCE
jgi:hypothetical protein